MFFILLKKSLIKLNREAMERGLSRIDWNLICDRLFKFPGNVLFAGEAKFHLLDEPKIQSSQTFSQEISTKLSI